MKVQLTCMGCDEQFEGEEPKMCCSGRDCGCMGLPIEPIICSKECYDKVLNRYKINHTEVVKNLTPLNQQP